MLNGKHENLQKFASYFLVCCCGEAGKSKICTSRPADGAGLTKYGSDDRNLQTEVLSADGDVPFGRSCSLTGRIEAGLEILTRRPAGRAAPTPLLFVHGAFAAAWCWDVHFLPWFAERGYTAHAVSLRGHGNSYGQDTIHGWSIQDYAEDVAAVVRQLEQPPVLIGHSMGGFVVQHCLDAGEIAGAVLMASVPPNGLAGPGLSLAVWNPAAALNIGSVQAMGGDRGSPSVMRDALFSSHIQHQTALAFLAKMGPESTRAMMDMYGGDLPAIDMPPSVPIHVLGASDDELIPSAFVRATARRFGTSPHILDDMGHLMMLDAEWTQAAESVLDWLHRNGL